ncbi:MAG: hypothetical protein ACUVR3_11330 [Candidatus Roseilinea sp.]|uniref:hypothetical protein n=1 Tax=Candidatus Roseilinea sp. TaxID=2838777 RepID=UPI004049597F
MTSFEILKGIRDQCAAIPGIRTCQIGIETPIAPDVYPIIRVVLSVTREHEQNGDPWRPVLEILIYYGEYVRPLDEGGLSSQHEWLLAMEDKIKSAVIPGHGWRGRWLETTWDEDRIPGLKLFASRFEVWS